MSRRLRAKRATAANLLRVIRAESPDLSALGCAYGCHSWLFDFDHATKTCTVCGAVYGMPAAEVEEMRAWAAGVCPDPDGHRREHDGHEVTIRARAEGRALVEVEGQCPYCDGRLPS